MNVDGTKFFHSTTARLLFAIKQANPDIQVIVTYLCTRVREPNVYDYIKLTRGIKYVCVTIYLLLLIALFERRSLVYCYEILMLYLQLITTCTVTWKIC